VVSRPGFCSVVTSSGPKRSGRDGLTGAGANSVSCQYCPLVRIPGGDSTHDLQQVTRVRCNGLCVGLYHCAAVGVRVRRVFLVVENKRLLTVAGIDQHGRYRQSLSSCRSRADVAPRPCETAGSAGCRMLPSLAGSSRRSCSSTTGITTRRARSRRERRLSDDQVVTSSA